MSKLLLLKKQLYLYHLIQTLTKSEKRYFKLYVGRTSKTTVKEYEVIYNLLLKAKEYNETSLKEASGVKNFAYQKKYLYDLILRCLVDYNQQEKSNNIGRSSFLAAEILFTKGLSYQALSQLKKQKKNAYQTELFGEIVSIIELEQKILSSRMDILDVKPEFFLLSKEKTDVLAKIAEVSYYETKAVEVLNIAHHSKNNRSEEAKSQYKALLAIVDEKANNFLCIRSQIKYFNIKGDVAYLTQKYKTAISYFERELTLAIHLKLNESNQVSFCAKTHVLATIYSRLILKEEFNRTVDLLSKTVNEIGSVPIKNRYELTIYILRLNFYILNKDYAYLKEYLATIPLDLSKYKPRFENNCNILSYNTACGYFYVGDYKKSLYWINVVLSENYKIMMPEVNAAAKLVNLVIHYQLGNFMLLESLIEAYKKNIKKASIYIPFEKLLLKFLTQLIQHPNKKKELAKEYVPQLMGFKSDKTIGSVFTIFEFEDWMNNIAK